MALDESSSRLSCFQTLGRFDRTILGWVAAHRPKWLVLAMRVVTHSADSWTVTVVLALYIALTLVAVVRGAPYQVAVGAGRATAGVLIGLSIFSSVKRKVSRVRPAEHALARIPDRFSMPSGHTTTAFAAALGVAFNVEPTYGSIALLWALLVAASRVVLGVHYPFDVIVGAIIGTCSAIIAVALSLPLY